MSGIRQMIQKGDPMLRVMLPEVLVQMLKSNAKKNKRRVQDQFIKSLAETFKYETEYQDASQKFLADLQHIYQEDK